jgi:hypothetical protein
LSNVGQKFSAFLSFQHLYHNILSVNDDISRP